jgi:hypothetical protein
LRARDLNRRALRRLPAHPVSSWDAYLAHNCRLPGPHANFELLAAAADEAGEARVRHWCASDRGDDDGHEAFLVMCGVVGLGKLAGDAFDETRRVPVLLRQQLRGYANDRRWRVREAVATALQRIGDAYLRPLLEIAEEWVDGTALERRAVVVAVGQPRFVAASNAASRERVPAFLDRAMASYRAEADRRAPAVVELGTALSAAWSVVLAGNDRAVAAFDQWVMLATDDADIRAVVAESCATQRLQRALPEAVAAWKSQISAAPLGRESPK